MRYAEEQRNESRRKGERSDSGRGKEKDEEILNGTKTH